MIETQNTLGNLALNTVFTIKYAMLERYPQFIKVTNVSAGTATYNLYTDATGSVLISSGNTAPASTTLFVIDLTS